MKQRIKEAALEIFDIKGYDGAGIRAIAAKAGCTLPTLYYYYKDKETLYRTVVCEAYEQLTRQIADQIPLGLSLRDLWYFIIMQRRLLGEDERRVFRLAHKAILGLDKAGSATERLRGYEKQRLEAERERVNRETGNSVFTRLLLRLMDQMLLSALVDEDDLDHNEIREEIDLLFDMAEQTAQSGAERP